MKENERKLHTFLTGVGALFVFGVGVLIYAEGNDPIVLFISGGCALAFAAKMAADSDPFGDSP